MDANSETHINRPFIEQEEQGHLVHDMKSPYNGIVGLSEPLAKMSKDPVKKRQLTWVNVSGARWCKHIEATVEASFLAQGFVDLKDDKVNIGFLIEEACALLSVAKDPSDRIIKSASVTVSSTVPADGLVTQGSDIHTAKCIFHLILNAIKFTDNGSISISHRCESEHIIIVISDTGIGMDSAQLSRAFEPFVKFTDRHSGESLGLGLTSTKEYIELVGGKIVLSSETAKGTTAELWIPLQAKNLTRHEKGPFGFGSYMRGTREGGPWLLQKRALGILTVDLLPAHYGLAGMADVLFNSEEKPQQKKQFAMIQRSANRIVEVLSLIRDACLRSEPQLLPKNGPCAFIPIAERVMTELNKALDKKGQPLKQKNVEFTFEPSGKIPIIIADPFYVYRIVYHLCENALKFTSEGKVSMTASVSSDLGLLIQITDTGVGFDMSKIEDIFHPLLRLDPGKFYGLGLGLCLVKDMAARISRSSIELNSVLGKGTSVNLILAEGTAMESLSTPEKLSSRPESPVVTIDIATNQTAPVASDEPSHLVTETASAPKLVSAERDKSEQVPPPLSHVGDDKEEQGKNATTPSFIVSEPIAQPPNDPKPVIEDKPSIRPTVLIGETNSSEEAETQKNPPANRDAEGFQFTFADMPKDEEDQETVKRKTLAGDKYRILVEMDDGSEPPSIQSALSNLSLAVEILKERIAVANATSSNIKGIIKRIESRYR
jgi:signal transduction histidine kinase